MTAAAFARGLLELNGEITPILTSLVRKDKAVDGLLDDTSGARKGEKGWHLHGSEIRLLVGIYWPCDHAVPRFPSSSLAMDKVKRILHAELSSRHSVTDIGHTIAPERVRNRGAVWAFERPN
jgi:hypothetical protein